MLRLSNHYKSLFVVGLIANFLIACSQNSGEGEDTTTATSTTSPSVTSANKPTDSKGVASPVDIKFSAPVAASALHLTGTLDLGSGIILSDARVSIGAIKIKVDKAEDDDEKALKEELKSKEKELEDSSGSDEAGFETQLDDIKTRYEALIEAAPTKADKEALETQREGEKDALEAQLAVVKKAKEDQLDAIKEAKDESIKWKGPYVYDLIGDVMTPALAETTVMDGTYKRIEFELKPNRSLEATDGLLNNSIYMVGTVDLAGVATPFKLAFPFSEEFKLMSTAGAVMSPGAANSLVIAFQPKNWFVGVDFSVGVKDAAGVIVIDDVNNASLLKAVKKNIKSSTKFGKDEDGDGELKADESDGDGQEAVEQEEAEEAQSGN